MKKNGFIATSILYTFFLVFITLFVALITNYIHNQVLIAAIDEASWDMLKGVNNTKISDLKAGDKIVFQTKKYGESYGLLNDANWTVAYVDESNTNKDIKTYYFISDLDVQNSTFNFKMSGQRIAKKHSVSISVINDLITRGFYKNAFYYNDNKVNKIEIGFPKLSVLKKARENADLDITRNAIFNSGGDFVVLSDVNDNNYKTGEYYNFRLYNFESAKNAKVDVNSLVDSYCGGEFSSTPDPNKTEPYITYKNNAYGYIHVDKDTKNETYVDYCIYGSPVNYTHYQKDLLVMTDENKNDYISKEGYLFPGYYFRLMASITVNANQTDTYISGGKGSITDPYLLIDGGRQ